MMDYNNPTERFFGEGFLRLFHSDAVVDAYAERVEAEQKAADAERERVAIEQLRIARQTGVKLFRDQE